MTIRWVVSGFAILGGLAGFVLVSHGYGSPHLHLPIYAVAAVVHLVAVLASRKVRDSRRVLLLVVTLALVMRAVALLSPDSRQGDYYRYMWDGALAAQGISPYRFSPAQVLDGQAKLPELSKLRQDGRLVLERVNHPELRTLYPPLAQALFALGYRIGPFDSRAWRAVLLALDLGAGLLILLMLRWARLPLAWSICYLWNPLLLVEAYHYRHLDAALAPFLLVFLWGAWKQRPYLAAAGLAAAVAVKIWPILLFPILAARLWPRRLALAKATMAFTIVLALVFIPYWASVRAAPSSGTVAYATTWFANQLGFDLIQKAGLRVSRMSNYAVESRVAARGILLLLLTVAASALGLAVRRRGIEGLALAASVVILLMLLAGPTVYPWYFLPALAASPFLRRPAVLFWAPLLILTALVPSAPHQFLLLVLIHLPAWLIAIVQVMELRRLRGDADA